ncbi:MAG: lipid-A-disaccharide synthase [Phycisphaerales bacterium]
MASDAPNTIASGLAVPAMAESPPRGILFTAFEPSGDDHAAAVIAELRRRHPSDQLPIFAWGGPKMAEAGAEVIERTGEDAVMGLPGIGKLLEHRRINRRIARWLASRSGGRGRVALHIPVDSPAANFPICKIARRNGLKVVHLVAPQVWAWGSWRIRKLRRLTGLVLCLLPFEEQWFLDRSVPARFIGHPLFEKPIDEAAVRARADELAEGIDRSGSPRLAVMPGSRPGEMEGCFPILLDAIRRLRADYPRTCALVAATGPEAADRLRRIAAESGGLPSDVRIVAGDTDAVIRWCDFALVVSGTVTLQIARQRKPMVTLYRPNRLVYQALGRWLVTTELFTLPNLIAGRAIIPEFIPHFGDGEALAVEVIKLLRRPDYAEEQRRELDAVCRRFESSDAPRAGPAAADAIERELGLKARTGTSARAS